MKRTNKIYQLSICLILLLFSCSKESSDWNIPKEKKDFHIFVLMGQSNMAGYGELLPQDTILVPKILKLPTLYDKKLDWKPAAHPLHNRLSSDRFGLGLPFAKLYLKKHKGVTVGIIPVAWGGAPIDNINKGSKVYNDFLTKAVYARKHGVIKGILWHQGESDTVDETLANSYEQKLLKMIKDVRTDLGIPELPFIVGNLAEFYGTGKDHCAPQRVKQINKVKNALKNLPTKGVNIGFAESTGAKSIDHHMVHFDRDSYILLGKNYFEEYERITNTNR